MRSWIARLFIHKIAPPSVRRSRSRFRPACEPLEAREVPAHYVWTPHNDAVNPVSFDNAGDWTEINSGPGAGVPGPGDDVIFDGRADNNSCPNMSGTGFHLVWVYNLYRGTVTLDGEVTTQQFILISAPATIDQAGHDITVTDVFVWSGGTLNVPGSEANFNIDGATGTITPGGGTLETASTINLEGGADVTLEDGEVLFTGDGSVEEDSFDVDGDSTFTCAATSAPAEIDRVSDGPLFLTINSGTFNASLPGGGPGLATNQSVRNEGGTFYVPIGTVVSITPPTIPLVPLWSYSQANSAAAQTKLEGSSTINAPSGFSLAGGDLWVIPIGGDTQPAIVGPFTMTGGTIQFNLTHTTGGVVAGSLFVDGNVTWSGGQYNPGYNPTQTQQCNFWKASGTMTISGTATLAGVKIGTGIINPANRWTVLLAATITGLPANGTTSGLALGSVGTPVVAIQLYLP